MRTALFGFVVGVLCAPLVYVWTFGALAWWLRRRRLRQQIIGGRREYELADPIWNAAMHIAANEGAEKLAAERAERDAA